MRSVVLQIVVDQVDGAAVAELVALRQIDGCRAVLHIRQRHRIGCVVIDENAGSISIRELVDGFERPAFLTISGHIFLVQDVVVDEAGHLLPGGQ